MFLLLDPITGADLASKFDIKTGHHKEAAGDINVVGPTFGGGHDIYICDMRRTTGQI